MNLTAWNRLGWLITMVIVLGCKGGDPSSVEQGSRPSKSQEKSKPTSPSPTDAARQRLIKDMEQAAVAWQNYYAATDKSVPTDYTFMLAFIEDESREAHVSRLFREGTIILNPKGTPQGVVIYEAKADKNGKRLVCFGNGTVKELGDAMFQELLKM